MMGSEHGDVHIGGGGVVISLSKLVLEKERYRGSKALMLTLEHRWETLTETLLVRAWPSEPRLDPLSFTESPKQRVEGEIKLG